MLRTSAAILAVLVTASAEAQDAITPTYTGIQKAIEAYQDANPGKTLSIPEILSRLPEHFRSGFTLFYDSGSLQAADEANPRVIMYGDDARTIMSFNGGSAQRGGDDLEFVYVDEVTSELVLRSMKFPSNDVSDGKVQFSEPNPPVCMGCHGPNAHYVWDQYASWQGAYGSRWDTLNPREAVGFESFLQNSAAHSRYKNLVREFRDISDYAPYQPQVAEREPSPTLVTPAIELRPNVRLGLLMLRHQARARVAEIVRSPGFEGNKYGFAYFMAGCDKKFGAPLLNEVKAKTGQEDLATYARFLGSDIKDGWRFSITRESVPDFVYYSGLWFFPSAMNGELWRKALLTDSDLREFYVPIKFDDYIRQHDNVGLTMTERGKDLWDIIDAQGLSPSTFYGAADGQRLAEVAGMPSLPQDRAGAACQILAEKQLGIR
ncbi:MAG: hypothetical protein AB7T49_03900 [Oligoflexales bacterium]